MDDRYGQLTNYIRSCLTRGLKVDQICQSLLLHGWRQEVIDAALSEAQKINTEPVEANQKADVKKKALFEFWRWPLTLSLAAFLFFNIYAVVYFGKFSILSVSTALSGAAAICIGTSFALSGISYYFNFLDRMLASRRNFGLTGYFLALSHAISLLFVDKNRYYFGFFKNLDSADFALGLGAMAILSLMAAISNNWSQRRLGGHRAHFILRFGYLAYFLLIVRAFVLENSIWSNWIAHLNSLPPPKLVVTIFASCVILLRIMLEISLTKAKRKKTIDNKVQPIKS